LFSIVDVRQKSLKSKKPQLVAIMYMNRSELTSSDCFAIDLLYNVM